uniref:Unknown protein from spot 146 of 2D-PAGE of etiolated coleoptile (Fragments) n=1 Tax=Zea mays TaxID=4577 RepID=UC03_MAIZE|nr:RecName: Full=Unknown protein from spot 146 of 2D-PAGE of etiolated coleoptile [Zea mays]
AAVSLLQNKLAYDGFLSK